MKVRPNKRQDIIEGALRLMAVEGPDGFSAANLARAAGVSKANLYHHFDSLEDIISESFEQYSLGLGMWVLPEGISFRDWLLATGREVFDIVGEDRQLLNAYFVFAIKAMFAPKLHRQLGKTYGIARGALCDVVSQLHPDPLEWGEVEVLADLIIMTLDGLGMHAQIFPERALKISAAWVKFVDHIAPLIEDKS